MRRSTIIIETIMIAMLMIGCAGPRITLFPDASDPLREMTLEGTAGERIALIPISGLITDAPKGRLVQRTPGLVQEVVSHLHLAEKDDRVKAVILKIDTPGGTTTASDMLYHEIASFKERTGKKIVACMMNLATSGGYYISLPADVILAHPTTVTGSVGVILMRPEVSGLMEKLGVGVTVNKSGMNKDMGSPFRPVTPAEENLLQELADRLGQRFVDLVKQHRRLDDQHLARVADARIFLAEDALAVGLVDRIGYLQDAIEAARQLADLDEKVRVVTYRRTYYPDDNLYNALTSEAGIAAMPQLVDAGLIGDLLTLNAGFYYLWPQALGVP